MALIDCGVHASIYDGVRLAMANGARLVRFGHNSAESLERHLSRLGGRGGALVLLDGVFSAFPRLLVPLHMGGLTELGFLTRSEEGGSTYFDRHEPQRHLTEDELLPLRRIPFYGSYVLGPRHPEVGLRRAYGSIGAAQAMSRFSAPSLSPDADTFWRQARPLVGPMATG